MPNSPSLPVTDEQIARLCHSICETIRQVEFEQIVVTHRGKPTAAITDSTSYEEIVRAVIADAQNAGGIPQLLAALFYGRDGTSFGTLVSRLGEQYAGERGFQSMVIDVDGLFDFGLMAERADVIRRHVCLISIDNVPTGTGVLVGPDLVLTNHHVVSSLIDGGTEKVGSEQRLTIPLARSGSWTLHWCVSKTASERNNYPTAASGRGQPSAPRRDLSM
jgi:hypothetical protein